MFGTIPSIPIPTPLANFGIELTLHSNSTLGIVASTPIPTQRNWGDLVLAYFTKICFPWNREIFRPFPVITVFFVKWNFLQITLFLFARPKMDKALSDSTDNRHKWPVFKQLTNGSILMHISLRLNLTIKSHDHEMKGISAIVVAQAFICHWLEAPNHQGNYPFT